jgi:hypothetical protein
MSPTSTVVATALVSALLGHAPAFGRETGRLLVNVRDGAQAVPCRLHLRDSANKTPKLAGWPAWDDHVVCGALARLELPAGRFHFEIERGPEYRSIAGALTIDPGRETTVSAELGRLADLKSEGWWSGELHVHRPVEDVPLLMQAEDLHVAPTITWWNNTNLWAGRALPAQTLVKSDGDRYYDVMAGEDEREGGALLYFGLKEPLAIARAGREYPSPMRFLNQARRQAGVHVDIEKPFWWDVPAWLASGQVDTIGIANNHMCRSMMHPDEAWGVPRDRARLPAPKGNGYWTQEIYYHVLNCGLRIPPSAGSASGVLANPVGYNRVYVHLDGDLDYARWFEGLRAGCSFVTNGPLLRVRAAGKLPGHVFTAPDQVDVELAVLLDGRDRVEAVEIIRDGRIERRVPTAKLAKPAALGKLTFTSSGWFLVRAIADVPRTFRFASTAPWYVEVGKATRRVSRASARFFLEWTDERIKRINVSDRAQREEVLEPHRRAREYWAAVLARANVD